MNIENNLLPEMFQYKDLVVPEGCHKISPSQINKFFTEPSLYYKECIMREENQFKGNTATTLGTICHYIFHCVLSGKSISREIINQQLEEYAKLRIEYGMDTSENCIDIDEIKQNYPSISEVIVNDYILKSQAKTKKSEESILVHLTKDVVLGGTTDLIEDDIICDFKIVGKKPDETVIPFNYKVQLLSYAYAFRQKGYDINRIRLIYGVKPTKTLPARCYVVTEEITSEHDKLIDDTLKLITDGLFLHKLPINTTPIREINM